MSDFAERREARNAQGLCANCNREREPGQRYCLVCAASHRKSMRVARQQRREEGKCIDCGKEPRKGSSRCEKCAKKNRARVSKYKKKIAAMGRREKTA